MTPETGCPFKDRPEYQRYAVTSGVTVLAYFSDLREARQWAARLPANQHATLYRKLSPVKPDAMARLVNRKLQYSRP